MKIVYRYIYMSVIARFALQTLHDVSPVGSGDDPHIGLYRASHFLFINGRQVADASSWKPGDQVEISNPVPYSRLIELGDLRMKVPGTDHVYQHAEIIVRDRYGSQVDINFTFMPVQFGNAAIADVFKRREGKGGAVSAAALQQQPALIITARQ